MSVFVCTIDGLKGHFKFIMDILSDDQQPTTPIRLLINHHGCQKAIKNPWC